MAKRKSMLSIDFSCFSDYAEQLDNLGADLKSIFADAMEQAAETVEYDTLEAIENANLPAGGQYRSTPSETEASVIRDAKVEWQGSIGEIGLGFDKTKPGPGGWLITGTPKMQPDHALEDIFGRKKYESQIKNDIDEVLQDEINKRIKG